MKTLTKTLLLSLSLCASASFAAAQETAEAPAPGLFERWSAEPAQIFDTGEANPLDFLWLARPLVVFADSPNDPLFRTQIDLLEDRLAVLSMRDVIVLTDTDPAGASPFRAALRPRGFMLVALDKDGRVLFRKPAPWDVREISRSIDKSPIRLQEIEDARLTR